MRVNRYKVIELFAGAGGMTLGFHKAGFDPVVLVEKDKSACSTLLLNMPYVDVIDSDIKDVDFTGMEADVVMGGFPCQAFSYAGLCEGFADIRGTLFFELIRCVREVQPKIVVCENVKGLLTHDNGRTLKTMFDKFTEIGYTIDYKILNAYDYDVPQNRERLIIIAVRDDCEIDAEFPLPSITKYTVGDALVNVPMSPGQKYSAYKQSIMSQVPEGGNWRDLPEEIQKEYMGGAFNSGGGRTGYARRLSMHLPSPTLLCSPSQKQTELCHPTETRPLTIREYARIQKFPDSWQFTGSVSSQYKQIGNAVPVTLAYHIANCIGEMLDELR